MDDMNHKMEMAGENGSDWILISHISLQIIAWGFIFPIGMVFGLTRSRWHVPLQLVGISLTLLGIFVGHSHGHQFPHVAHASFASWILFLVIGQGIMGTYLKLHWNRGLNAKLRPMVVFLHGVLGRAFPVIGYAQMVLGVIAATGFCFADHFGQCLAHFIMGSSFIAYGIVMILILRVGGPWLRRRNKSPEWYDSWVIMLWGIVNAFTEHRWGQPWNHGDMQHTSLGILWWTGGMVGIFLSRNGKRSVVPALVILFTGYSMVGHAQHSQYSLKIHSLFGYVLMSGAISRIIEVCFVVNENSEMDKIHPFQHLPCFLLILSGYLFMGATEEQVQTFERIMIDVSSYGNVLISFAFITFLYTHGLITLWQRSGQNAQRSAMNGHRLSIDRNGHMILADHDSLEFSEEQKDFEEELEMGCLNDDYENEGRS
ncbi:uncharacterized protein VTP21DRAFT_8497 [Calcarisporiella thermophila]|uniref:uncharacterized protein n=1 Tax=Calcarisporiella thermophila TaxID=911321 RepID=UPI003743A30B